MANPNLLGNASITQDVLVEAQLASGDNDFTVPAGKSWQVRSFTVTNVTGSSVTLNASVIKSGGTARKVAHNLPVVAGETITLERLVAVLPEAAVLRLNSGAATSLDVVITGVVSV